MITQAQYTTSISRALSLPANVCIILHEASPLLFFVRTGPNPEVGALLASPVTATPALPAHNFTGTPLTAISRTGHPLSPAVPNQGAGFSACSSMNFCSPCGCRKLSSTFRENRSHFLLCSPTHLADTSIKTLIPLWGSYSCIGLFPRNSGSVPEGRSWFLVILAAPAGFCVGGLLLPAWAARLWRRGPQPTSRPSCVFPSPSRGGGQSSARSTPGGAPRGTNKSLGFNDRTAEENCRSSRQQIGYLEPKAVAFRD